MVLLAELLLAVGVLLGVYRLATRPGDGMSEVEPDRSPEERRDGPLTADELVALHLPMGFGYRKIDVDLLLDRIARQLPRATYEPTGEPGSGRPGEGPFAAALSREPGDRTARPDDPDRVSLTKEDDRG